MRQLLPEAIHEVDIDTHVSADLRTPKDGQPWLLVNMVATVDGAITVGGLSGPLGGPTDKALFHALRGVADVVLVGAGTARTEGYGPARERPDGSPGPRIAVVTRSGALDPGARLFTGGSPIVLTCAACPADRRAALEEVAEVVVAGDDDVDLRAGLAALDAAVVLCEGGPTLNGQLLADDLVDEWRLTVSPMLAGGSAARSVVGPDVAAALRLDRVLVDADFLFLQYLRG